MNRHQKSNDHQDALGLFSKTNQATENSGPFPTKPENENDPRSNKSVYLNWETFVLWSLVLSVFWRFFGRLRYLGQLRR